jgi:hypothetical protein
MAVRRRTCQQGVDGVWRADAAQREEHAEALRQPEALVQQLGPQARHRRRHAAHGNRLAQLCVAPPALQLGANATAGARLRAARLLCCADMRS